MKALASFLLYLFLLSGNSFAQNAIVIDPGKTGEPISTYIYGQFIEHLGRCIYGGIWAEMLEDRKFYYPVTDDFDPWGTASDRNWGAGDYQYLNASPWRVIGQAGTVTMDSTAAYVGDQTPVIHLPGNGIPAGIAQDGLAVVRGKQYTGRIILSGGQGVTAVTVSLVLDGGARLSQAISGLSTGFTSYPLYFTAPASSDSVTIEITGTGSGTFAIGTLSLMPSDNINGWRPDVVALLKELNAPIYRWPGGNFVSGYNWRDGIGERDKRPPRKNPAWRGVEHNDVGIHEYMELMAMIDAEPFVSVNTGLGTVEEVAEEVEYFNGSANTQQGKLRAENGHTAPYDVTWWAVGNEMYGNWQLGHIPLEEYVQKHNRVAEAMWKVDPDIKLVGVGSIGEWDKMMLKVCAGYMNLISEHLYCRDMPDVTRHTRQLADQIAAKAAAHRNYRNEIEGLAGKDIRIAMDEWNYWYGDYIYGELGVRYHHKDALGVAIGLHEYFRNSDIYYMANYAQTVNVIGCIKTTRTSSGFATTGLPLKLYRNHFGTIPVEITVKPYELDVSAAWTTERDAITVSIVNPTGAAMSSSISLGNIAVNPEATRWIIQNDDPEAYNNPGEPPMVTTSVGNVQFDVSPIEFPPYSIVMHRLEIIK